MPTCMVRSDAGREEIRAKALALSRPARNLLLVIDGSRPVEQWLQLVNGATESDLKQLVDSGLVQESAGPAAATRAPRAERPAGAAAEPPLAQVLQTRDYQFLYATLTREASVHFGALKRYKMVLDVERCSGVDELRALALRWYEQIRQDKGDAQARAFCSVFKSA